VCCRNGFAQEVSTLCSYRAHQGHIRRRSALCSYRPCLVEGACTQQGRAHIRRLHPDWAARPALMRFLFFLFFFNDELRRAEARGAPMEVGVRGMPRGRRVKARARALRHGKHGSRGSASRPCPLPGETEAPLSTCTQALHTDLVPCPPRPRLVTRATTSSNACVKFEYTTRVLAAAREFSLYIPPPKP
jgi:hypothetical protein